MQEIYYKKWNKSQRKTLLLEERENLSKKFDRLLPKIGDSMAKESYSADLVSKIDFHFPKEMRDLFWAWVYDNEKDEKKGKSTYFEMCNLANKKISELDRQIRELF